MVTKGYTLGVGINQELGVNYIRQITKKGPTV